MKTPRQPAPNLQATAPPDLPTSGSDACTAAVRAEQRHALIERAAYRLAERRGFSPGEELDDWLAAEVEVDRQLGETEADLR